MRPRIIPKGIKMSATAYDLILEIEEARKVQPRKRTPFQSDVCNLAAYTEYKNDRVNNSMKPMMSYLKSYGVSTFPSEFILKPFMEKVGDLTYSDIIEIKRLKNLRQEEQKKANQKKTQSLHQTSTLLVEATTEQLIAQLKTLGEWEIYEVCKIKR